VIRLMKLKVYFFQFIIHLFLRKCGAAYKIESPDNSSNSSSASLIADAILREPEAVQLVAYCPDNSSQISP